MVDVNKLPLSTTSFSNFILKNKIYVDKTDLVAQLASGVGPVLLSRPRRFGKSTLVSTFEELFTHGLEKFKGLKIDTQNLWHDKTYKVLHLDFSAFREDVAEVTFADKLFAHLKTKLKRVSLDIVESKYVISSFNDALENAEDNSLVLLIDEYDAPLIATMGDANEFNNRRKILSDFFLSIKSYAAKFRFIFITGVTRYSHVSIFSGFNNLKDKSFDPIYGTIVGYTQEELEFYFKAYLENAALALNQEENTDKYTYDLILQKIKENYDGFSFDLKELRRVYNPWSILSFLEYPDGDFDAYWFNSGGYRPKLLTDYIESKISEDLNKTYLLNFLDKDFLIKTTVEKLTPALNSLVEGPFPYEAILYQAGYFTLKRVDGSDLYIGLTNLEVQKKFERFVLEKLLNTSIETFSYDNDELIKSAFNHKNLNNLKELLNVILNECSYETVPTFEEKHFRDLYKGTIKCLGFKTHTETLLSEGRAELDIEALKYVYVLELKVVNENDPQKIEEKLLEAKAQIKDLKYDKRLDKWLNGREVVGLACVIVNQNKDEKHDTTFREVVRLVEVGPVRIETKKD